MSVGTMQNGGIEMQRRTFLATASSFVLVACNRVCAPLSLPLPAMTGQMIDGHCHLFNAKDLSTVRFVRYVLLERYPDLASLAPVSAALGPDDPDTLDQLIIVILALVGAGFAPSAVHELALLERKPTLPNPRGEDQEVVSEAKLVEQRVQSVADFLAGEALTPYAEVEAELRAAITVAGRDSDPVTQRSAGRAGRVSVSRRALTMHDATEDRGFLQGRAFDIAGIFNFIGQLRRFRHCLVDELATLHRNDGQNPLLMVPAMVDFGRWLRDDPEKGSTFADQTALWRRISIRPGGPAIHGYVAFCPLRQVLHDRCRLASLRNVTCVDDPLTVVRTALEVQGFLGVKLYPPMGFRAADNRSRHRENFSVPKHVLEDVFGQVGSSGAEVDEQIAKLGGLLDGALNRLYALCTEPSIRAPIMAHGANSISAFEHSGALADPYFWRPVFELPSAPTVMLAHVGGFADVSADPEGHGAPTVPTGLLLTEAEQKRFNLSWEVSLARYIEAHLDGPVFADISMFTELFLGDHSALILRFFQELDRRYPAFKQHLVFGTDWLMLSQHGFASRYDHTIRTFLEQAFGAGHVEPIMRLNFLRYAGLAAGGVVDARVSRIYEGNPVLHDRLALLYPPLSEQVPH